MTLTAHDAIRHIQHTLSSDEVPSIGAFRILNDAGEYLVNMHNWRWLEGAQAKLDLEKDVDHVWLPENFREIIGYDATQGLTSGLSLTTHQYLVELRSNEISTSAFQYWAAVTHAQRQVAASSQLICATNPSNTHTITLNDNVNSVVTFTFSTTAGTVTETVTSREVVLGATSALTMVALTDAINTAPALLFSAADNNITTPDSKVNLTYERPGTGGNLGAEASWFTDPDARFSASPNMAGGIGGGPPRPRLDIYPTPTADVLEGFTLYFRRGWDELGLDGELVSIPSFVEALYLQVVRAFARGYERESEADVSQRLASVAGGPLFSGARMRDMESQPDLGPMMNGAAQMEPAGRGSGFWNYTSVGAPS